MLKRRIWIMYEDGNYYWQDRGWPDATEKDHPCTYVSLPTYWLLQLAHRIAHKVDKFLSARENLWHAKYRGDL